MKPTIPRRIASRVIAAIKPHVVSYYEQRVAHWRAESLRIERELLTTTRELSATLAELRAAQAENASLRRALAGERVAAQ